MGLLRFLLITVFVLWLIRILLKLVFPIVLKNMFSKMQQQGAGPAPQPKKPEGSISIDYMPPQPKAGNAEKLGDFVDYEEVK